MPAHWVYSIEAKMRELGIKTTDKQMEKLIEYISSWSDDTESDHVFQLKETRTSLYDVIDKKDNIINSLHRLVDDLRDRLTKAEEQCSKDYTELKK